MEGKQLGAGILAMICGISIVLNFPSFFYTWVGGGAGYFGAFHFSSRGEILASIYMIIFRLAGVGLIIAGYAILKDSD